MVLRDLIILATKEIGEISECVVKGDPKFTVAWLFHQNRNPHHWQFWIFALDDGGMLPVPMPEKYAKDEIIGILLATGRIGMDEMVDFLEHGSDFFTAPASTKYHLAYEGGLAEHSLFVRNTIHSLNDTFGTHILRDQLDIVSLLHDVCKTGCYVEKEKWRKDDHGKWESYTEWSVEDKLPLGHGEKSLYLVGKFLDLFNEEAAPIR